MKKSTKKLTVSAILCAICVVIMIIGSVFEVMDLSVAAICSFAVLFSVIELGGFYPVAIWIVVSVLGSVVLPVKLPAVYFSLFFGWYPILKAFSERHSILLRLLIKIFACVASLFVILQITRIFFPEELTQSYEILLYPLCVAVFLLYDVAMSRIKNAYLRTWKRRLGIRI